MSDTTITATTTNPETGVQGQSDPLGTAGVQEPNPAAPVPDNGTAADAVAEQLAVSQAQAEQDQEARTEAAEQTLKQAARAHRQAETGFRRYALEAGQLAGLYVQQRLALGHSRDNAVKALAGRLAEYASSTIDAGYVNRLIRTYHAHRLLAVEAGVSDKQSQGTPFGHYRDAWVQLVERQHGDTPQETYVLLPGLEAESRALYAKALEAGWGKDEAQEAVKVLQAQRSRAQAVIRDQEASKAREAEKAAAVAFKAEQERLQLAQAQAQAARQAEQEQLQAATRLQAQAQAEKVEAERQRLTAEAEAARQQAETEAAKVREAQKTTQAAEAEAARATAGAAKAEGKAVARAPKTTKPEPTTNTAPVPLQGHAKATNAAEVAEMAAELVTGCDAPDDVLEALLRLLDAHKELSRISHRVVKAALLELARSTTRPTPAAMPSTNGRQLVGAA